LTFLKPFQHKQKRKNQSGVFALQTLPIIRIFAACFFINSPPAGGMGAT
jgi:hypothetical protein